MNEITKTQINSIDTPGNYLQYVETEKGGMSWKIIPLNWVERIIRWLGCFYENTTLPFIAGKVNVAPALPEELKEKMFAIFNRSYPGRENPFSPKPALAEPPKIAAPKVPLQSLDERPLATSPKEDVVHMPLLPEPAATKPSVVDVPVISVQNPPETKLGGPDENPTTTVPEEEVAHMPLLPDPAAPSLPVVDVPVVSVKIEENLESKKDALSEKVVSPTGMERPLVDGGKISDEVPAKIQTPPPPLHCMTNLVTFHQPEPSEITINRNWSCRPSEPENAWKKPYLVEPATVESVKAALKIGGPFAAIAALGPRRYTVEPTRFDNQISGHLDVPVYGWKAGAQRTAEIFKQSIIICGVQRRAELEQIYYVLADDVSENPEMAIGKYRASADKRVFATSLKTYTANESDVFPPVSKEEIERFRSQRVVPSPLAGKPDLIQAWKKGKIRCELKEEKWHVSKAK